MLKLLAAAVALAAAAAVVAPRARPAEADQQPAQPGVLCEPFQHMATTGRDGARYIIRNDNYGRKPECLSNSGRSSNFAIVRSGARVAGREPVAFPNIFLGCSWGVCSPGSGLPMLLDRVHTLVSTWSTTERADGVWAACFDIWFDRVRAISGQSGGAEIMIWLNARKHPAGRGPVVTVDHVRWRLSHWVTSGAAKRWEYIQFRRVRPVLGVTNLDVSAFIRLAELDGFVRPRWWLTSVEAGFEIWRGGVGLRTNEFSARV
jgi:hypothetical protein